MNTIYTVLIGLWCIAPLFSSTYYVSNTGSNSNNGLTPSTSFLTLQFAADLVVAGDTVLVENGTYVGFDLRYKNGTLSDPIVFQASGNAVLINQSGPIRDDGINIEDADFIVINGFIVNGMTGNGNGIRVVLSDHCVVRNCSCNGNAERGIFTGFTDDILIEYNTCSNSVDEHGIYVSNSSDRPIIRYNECYGNNNTGIHINGDLSAGGDGIISDAQIYGNIIRDNNLAAGINMDGVEDAVIYNNLIYNNHFSQGISMFQIDGAIMTHGAKIYNNTIIVPADGRWGILLKNGADVDTEIYNNIIINEHAWRGCIAAESVSQLTSNYNIVNDKLSHTGDGSTITFAQWQALGLDLNSQVAGPMNSIFQDMASNNYALSTNSQAQDIGTNAVNGLVNTDINGTSRPIGNGYDIGAYESTSALPVELIEFTARLDLGRVLLSWLTAQEIDLEGFGIEHSNDTENWKILAFVPASGDGSKYEYWHHQPQVSNYYRLKKQDLDGVFSYSSIESILLPSPNSISIFPNPALHKLRINGIQEGMKLRIADSSGKLIYQAGANPYDSEICISHWQSGIYFLFIQNNKNAIIFQDKFVVQSKY